MNELAVIARVCPCFDPTSGVEASMNELVYQAMYRFAEVPTEVVSRQLVDIPMFAIKEVIPLRAFKALSS